MIWRLPGHDRDPLAFQCDAFLLAGCGGCWPSLFFHGGPSQSLLTLDRPMPSSLAGESSLVPRARCPALTSDSECVGSLPGYRTVSVVVEEGKAESAGPPYSFRSAIRPLQPLWVAPFLSCFSVSSLSLYFALLPPPSLRHG